MAAALLTLLVVGGLVLVAVRSADDGTEPAAASTTADTEPAAASTTADTEPTAASTTADTVRPATSADAPARAAAETAPPSNAPPPTETAPPFTTPPSQTDTPPTDPATTPPTAVPSVTPQPTPATAAAPTPASTVPPPVITAGTDPQTTIAVPSSGAPGNRPAPVLAEPLPSGAASADLLESLLAAQRFTDALAAEDWTTARSLSSDVRSASDAQLEDGYGGLDRATLLLVDGHPVDDGDRLLVVSVANERSGAQTTLYCIETVVRGGDVSQVAAAVLDRYAGTLGVDGVTGDPALTDSIRERCVLR